jgi:hypothetical protein
MPHAEVGKKIRDAQLDFFELRDQEFLNMCRVIAVAHAQQFGTVSINDVRQRIAVPKGTHPSVLGAVFKGKRFKAVGYTEATHPSAHARVVRVYQLNNTQGEDDGGKTH